MDELLPREDFEPSGLTSSEFLQILGKPEELNRLIGGLGAKLPDEYRNQVKTAVKSAVAAGTSIEEAVRGAYVASAKTCIGLNDPSQDRLVRALITWDADGSAFGPDHPLRPAYELYDRCVKAAQCIDRTIAFREWVYGENDPFVQQLKEGANNYLLELRTCLNGLNKGFSSTDSRLHSVPDKDSFVNSVMCNMVFSLKKPDPIGQPLKPHVGQIFAECCKKQFAGVAAKFEIPTELSEKISTRFSKALGKEVSALVQTSRLTQSDLSAVLLEHVNELKNKLAESFGSRGKQLVENNRHIEKTLDDYGKAAKLCKQLPDVLAGRDYRGLQLRDERLLAVFSAARSVLKASKGNLKTEEMLSCLAEAYSNLYPKGEKRVAGDVSQESKVLANRITSLLTQGYKEPVTQPVTIFSNQQKEKLLREYLDAYNRQINYARAGNKPGEAALEMLEGALEEFLGKLSRQYSKQDVQEMIEKSPFYQAKKLYSELEGNLYKSFSKHVGESVLDFYKTLVPAINGIDKHIEKLLSTGKATGKEIRDAITTAVGNLDAVFRIGNRADLSRNIQAVLRKQPIFEDFHPQVIK